MTKDELIDRMSNEAGISKEQAGIAVDILFNTIRKVLEHHDKVLLRGFSENPSEVVACRVRAAKGWYRKPALIYHILKETIYHPFTTSVLTTKDGKVTGVMRGGKVVK